jgi:hypothetical protein
MTGHAGSRFALLLTVVVLAAAGATCAAAPPDGYLSGPSCALGQPVGVGPALLIPHASPAKPGSQSSRPPAAVASDPGGNSARFAGVTLAEVEQRLAAYLDRAFRHPDALSVQAVAPEGVAPAAGLLEAVHVEIRGGKLDVLPVTHARFRFQDVKLDVPLLVERGDVELAGTSPVEARVVVSEAGLNEALNRRRDHLAIDAPRVEIRDGQVRFSGRLRSRLASASFSTAGTFRLVRGGLLHFVPSRFTVGFLRVPGIALSTIARSINPILDLSRFRCWRGVAFQPGRVLVEGNTLVIESAGAGRLEPAHARPPHRVDRTGANWRARART